MFNLDPIYFLCMVNELIACSLFVLVQKYIRLCKVIIRSLSYDLDFTLPYLSNVFNVLCKTFILIFSNPLIIILKCSFKIHSFVSWIFPYMAQVNVYFLKSPESFFCTLWYVVRVCSLYWSQSFNERLINNIKKIIAWRLFEMVMWWI